MLLQDTFKHQNKSPYLVLRVRFLLNRYHGGEYPPSPRRLFLAFVSALYQSTYLRINEDAGEEALHFLEKLQPPTIHAPYHPGCKYTIFVPNNDRDVISKNYARGKGSNYDPKKLTSGKQMNPHIVDMIQYSWKIGNDNKSEKYARILSQLAQEIPVLGLGIDPVSVHGDIVDSIPYLQNVEQYVADENTGGMRMQVPQPGLLEDAKRHHNEFLDRIEGDLFRKPTPMTKYREQRYRKHKQLTKMFVFKITNSDTNLRFIPNNNILTLIKKFKDKMGLKDSQSIKTVALPSIGSKYADARVRRIAIIMPPNNAGAGDDLHRRLHIQKLHVGGENYDIEPIQDKDGVYRFYSRTSKLWRTVTPVDLKLPKHFTRQDVTQNILDLLRVENISEHVTFVNFRKEPYWNGLEKTYSNTSLHVELEFNIHVKGPFLIGQNQHLGNGLFAPSNMPKVAYFTILGERPPIENTVLVADLMRKSVMSRIGKAFGVEAIPSYISGHDRHGGALRDNHKQAFWLPADTDHDGFIDHIAVFVQDGFDKSIQNLFYGIRELNNGHDLKLDVSFRGFYSREDIEKKCDLFSKQNSWRSGTPYFMPWHEKKKFGRNEQIKKECKMRGFDYVGVADYIINLSKKPISINRFYNRHNKLKPINHLGSALKISFSNPTRGPISLGFGAHFGLGMFIPDNNLTRS